VSSMSDAFRHARGNVISRMSSGGTVALSASISWPATLSSNSTMRGMPKTPCAVLTAPTSMALASPWRLPTAVRVAASPVARRVTGPGTAVKHAVPPGDVVARRPVLATLVAKSAILPGSAGVEVAIGITLTAGAGATAAAALVRARARAHPRGKGPVPGTGRGISPAPRIGAAGTAP